MSDPASTTFLAQHEKDSLLCKDVPQHSAPNLYTVPCPYHLHEIAILTSNTRGVLVNISTLCLSSTIGRCIDHSSSRLRPLQVTIFLQRASIFFACMSWASIAAHNSSSKGKDGDKADHVSRTHDIDRTELGVVIVIVLVSIVESLCAVGNTISMERDWVRACKLLLPVI